MLTRRRGSLTRFNLASRKRTSKPFAVAPFLLILTLFPPSALLRAICFWRLGYYPDALFVGVAGARPGAVSFFPFYPIPGSLLIFPNPSGPPLRRHARLSSYTSHPSNCENLHPFTG